MRIRVSFEECRWGEEEGNGGCRGEEKQGEEANSDIVPLIRRAGVVMAEVEEEGTKGVAEGVAVLDFDMLCATVALQTQGFSEKRRKAVAEAEEEEEEREEGGEFGGVQRMWEGDILDCMEDRRIAIEAAW